MKNTFLILFTAIIIFLSFALFLKKDEVKAKDYQRQFDSLKTEICRIKAEIKAVKANTDTLKANTDTLKVGQRIIFDEVKKNAEKSFWDFFEP